MICKKLLPCIALGLAASCATFPDALNAALSAEEMIEAAYAGAPDVLVKRAVQDADQKLCSRPASEKLSSEEAERVTSSAKASMRYPSSGKLAGDWKAGEQLVSNAAGMRIRDGRIEQVNENGALCVNCHALDPKDLNVGNLGPALTGYGAQHGNSDAVIKYTYEKIYNAWAYYPCSNMPRLGHNGYLTPEQIAHVVAYLVDLQSPVNRK
jgi:sulfur-oxidizing protein SoxX